MGVHIAIPLAPSSLPDRERVYWWGLQWWRTLAAEHGWTLRTATDRPRAPHELPVRTDRFSHPRSASHLRQPAR